MYCRQLHVNAADQQSDLIHKCTDPTFAPIRQNWMVLALEKQIHTAIHKSKVVSIGFTIELGQSNLIYSDVLIWDDKDSTQDNFTHI